MYVRGKLCCVLPAKLPTEQCCQVSAAKINLQASFQTKAILETRNSKRPEERFPGGRIDLLRPLSPRLLFPYKIRMGSELISLYREILETEIQSTRVYTAGDRIKSRVALTSREWGGYSWRE